MSSLPVYHRPALRFGRPARRPAIHRALALLAAAATVALGAGCDDARSDADAARTALEQQRRELLEQFATAQNQVRHTQAQALDHPDVTPLRDRFYELLRERMIAIEPDAEAWLDRARTLGAEIDDLSRPQILEPGEQPSSMEERTAVVEEFRELEQALRPVQNRAMAEPQVAAAFQALQDSVHTAMVRINPDAEGALAQMRRTSAAVDSIDARLRALDADGP